MPKQAPPTFTSRMGSGFWKEGCLLRVPQMPNLANLHKFKEIGQNMWCHTIPTKNYTPTLCDIHNRVIDLKWSNKQFFAVGYTAIKPVLLIVVPHLSLRGLIIRHFTQWWTLLNSMFYIHSLSSVIWCIIKFNIGITLGNIIIWLNLK